MDKILPNSETCEACIEQGFDHNESLPTARYCDVYCPPKKVGAFWAGCVSVTEELSIVRDTTEATQNDKRETRNITRYV